MWCFALTLLFLAGVDLSSSLAVQRTRAPLRARDQIGVTLEAISNTTFTGTVNRQDIRYVTNITVNDQNFRVLIDTGSSDLLLYTNQDFTFDDTGIPVSAGFTASSTSGTVGFASVTLGGYTVPQQVFNHALASAGGPAGVLELGLDGLIGLSFDGVGDGLSPLTDALLDNNSDPTRGAPFIFNVFAQTPNQNNFIGVSLSRTDDLEGTADASLTINEVDPKYEAALNAPLLPVYPADGGVWSILMDGVTVDGQNVPLPQSQATIPAPAGSLVVTMDSGTPDALVPPAVVNAIYSLIPGAMLVTSPGPTLGWNIPCNTTSIVSLQFGGQSFPIHPLDLSDVYRGPDGSISCVTPWVAESPDTEEDILFGASLMRNFYSVFNFADSDSELPSRAASMQLLSQTDATTAGADAITVRTALFDSSASSTGSAPQATGPADATAHKNGACFSVFSLNKYVLIVVGILLGGLVHVEI
ncbi:aspartic peptidase domain-containing protein [Mycena galopus ATCC 62051]|nr:aspartic peptidase domain-containing protein [Mycena galopus ATCC 62051]